MYRNFLNVNECQNRLDALEAFCQKTDPVMKISLKELAFKLDLDKMIKKVVFNDPATIVLWRDGQKTVVKAHNEPFDKEKGLLAAIVKYCTGNNSKYNTVLKKWCN